jgi:hypothetical protein
MEWLAKLLPLAGTALGGPLGGVAASFIAERLSIPEKTVKAVTEALQEGQLSPEQLTSLKQAEIDFQKFLAANNIKLEELAVNDKKDARALLIAVRSKIPAVLSITVTLGYFGVLVGMMLGKLAVTDSQALLIMLGSLGTSWGMVMSFWFGTTSGSMAKNDLLANSAPKQ